MRAALRSAGKLRVEGKDRQVQEVAVQAEVRDMTAGTEHGGQSKH